MVSRFDNIVYDILSYVFVRPVYAWKDLLWISTIEIVDIDPGGAVVLRVHAPLVEFPAGFVESLDALPARWHGFVLVPFLGQLIVVEVLQVFGSRASEGLVEVLFVEIVVWPAAAPRAVADEVKYQPLEES